ncbi:MAG: hypothetical protein K8S25_08780 [Alphaproteobacteria bacterium]|nr:hypothetical protein [Alphaproteobacteria bacterium]
MRTLVLVALLAAPLGGCTEAFKIKTVSAEAHVGGGDRVSLAGIPDIRLQGVSAPEDTGPNSVGAESTRNLRDFVEGKNIVCHLDGTRTSDGPGARPIATCFLGETDLGFYQISTGHARDCPRFSKGRYAEAEAKARATRDLSAIYPLPGYCTPR